MKNKTIHLSPTAFNKSADKLSFLAWERQEATEYVSIVERLRGVAKSPTEREVVRLLLDNASPKEIAAEAGISLATAYNVLNRLKARLEDAKGKNGNASSST